MQAVGNLLNVMQLQIKLMLSPFHIWYLWFLRKNVKIDLRSYSLFIHSLDLFFFGNHIFF